MEQKSLTNKFISATKWSTVTEIVAKLVTPITNMILARIISPEAFGVVATVTMIMSFADMFTDAGFQKYLIQHEFKSEEEKFKNANVAFWTNLAISCFLLMFIIVFRNKLASMVGNPGLGNVISISSIQLILTSFSSIQMALYRREFDFKTLFIVRLVAICIPFLITLPLAYAKLSYWSIIIGGICIQLSNAIILTIKSKWKPRIFYEVQLLKKMIGFSIWSLVEAISIWATVWADMFIIGNSLNQYYLGIYKIATAMVNNIMSIVTAAIVPVLFSTLSRLKDDNEQFENIYLTTQRAVSIFIFPLGFGIYLYSDLATQIILGSKWGEASYVIGVWALTSSIMIVLGNFCSEVYRAKGRPKLSFIAQMLHLIVLVPACMVSSRYGFKALVYSRSWIRMEFILIHLIIMKEVVGFSILRMFKNIKATVVSTLIMGCFGYGAKQLHSGIIWSITSILICSLVYFGCLYLFSDIRNEINIVIRKIRSKLIKL
ncbi:lipopolysaccharide biosynthesis protein [Clostridium botulinum]|uniref:Polysaccharide biosynthesis protein n=1 Tax=Clostridium botulinum TaxID=1491 RepID=A0A9Q1ZCU3_CLOBO|nr:lipopolysaccharide biosynthesis protein [Clostridium botulinum]AEB75395.1 polysaccharide biosynthesis protein [Clostridium botulinum BKT015925]KEH99912.1 polysaccharide biosynthesis protein [Clostridium botulinum D str. 16868]KEI03768.1 polysaccharide biosynthesis protein [Clostridium botulinum C/D str. Sp77]KLU76359.1 polysaccharide biosynthesis protein [Clostridium botulinum V891]KOA73637.1 polysaccharide biosynthesis protein [Clostridium botulinum]